MRPVALVALTPQSWPAAGTDGWVESTCGFPPCLTGGSGTAAPVSIAVISRLSHVDCEWSESSVVLSRISLRRASGHEPPRSLFQNRVSACLGGQTGVEDPSALDAVAIRHRVHADLTRDEGDLGVLQRQR